MGICISNKNFNKKDSIISQSPTNNLNSKRTSNHSTLRKISNISKEQNLQVTDLNEFPPDDKNTVLKGFYNGIKKFIFKPIEDDKNSKGRVINFELIGKGVGNPLENYSIERLLFETSAGAIWLTKHKLTQTLRTMKIINKENSNEESEKRLMDEINILKTIDHPNIVKIFEFYNEKDKLYIIQEYGQGGKLLDYIVEHSPVSELCAANIIYQVLCALSYGFNRKLFHLDLKPDNIIIDYISNEQLAHIKVMDFGCSNIIQYKGKSLKIPLTSIYYTSPEFLDGKYDHSNDMWSLGVILYVLLAGRAPFMGNKQSEIKDKIIRGNIDLREPPWNKVSKEAKDLLRKILVENPNKRITFKEALKHPWILKHKLKERVNHIDTEILYNQIENLKNYTPKRALQDAVLSFLIHNSLHLPQMRESCNMFCLVDKDDDGVITQNELIDFLENSLSLDNESSIRLTKEIFYNVDLKNKGYIEFEEFVKACVNKERLLDHDILRYAFNYFDKDKSGDISPEELKLVFFGEAGSSKEDFEVIKTMFLEADKNGNGEIDFGEFVEIMKTIIK